MGLTTVAMRGETLPCTYHRDIPPGVKVRNPAHIRFMKTLIRPLALAFKAAESFWLTGM
jgi:hypothetical protein